MSLLSVADSAQAKEFVEGLVVFLKSKELRKRKRQAEREKAFATAIELIIADLMLRAFNNKTIDGHTIRCPQALLQMSLSAINSSALLFLH